MLNKPREPLLDNNSKIIFSNAKERKFCVWKAAGDDGWSQAAWDTYGWDDTALEPGQARLGAGSQYSRSPAKAFDCSLISLSFPGQNIGPEVSSPALMAPPERDSEAEEQKDFVVSEQNNQTTFSVLIFFLEISAWPGGFC